MAEFRRKRLSKFSTSTNIISNESFPIQSRIFPFLIFTILKSFLNSWSCAFSSCLFHRECGIRLRSATVEAHRFVHSMPWSAPLYRSGGNRFYCRCPDGFWYLEIRGIRGWCVEITASWFGLDPVRFMSKYFAIWQLSSSEKLLTVPVFLNHPWKSNAQKLRSRTKLFS